MNLEDLELNSYYNFVVYGEPIFGGGFFNLKFTGTSTYESADVLLRYTGVSLEQLQRRLEPFLPLDTDLNYKNYKYYNFLDKNGKFVIIADKWFVPDSIEHVGNSDKKFILRNVSMSKLDKVRELLGILGIQYTEE